MIDNPLVERTAACLRAATDHQRTAGCDRRMLMDDGIFVEHRRRCVANDIGHLDFIFPQVEGSHGRGVLCRRFLLASPNYTADVGSWSSPIGRESLISLNSADVSCVWFLATRTFAIACFSVQSSASRTNVVLPIYRNKVTSKRLRFPAILLARPPPAPLSHPPTDFILAAD